MFLSLNQIRREKEVYIKRKAIKHFTESRIKELYKFSKEKQLEIVLSISEDVEMVLSMPDIIYKNTKRENSFIYIKKIDELKTPRAVVLESSGSHFEIVSIHMIKDKDYEKHFLAFKNKNN